MMKMARKSAPKKRQSTLKPIKKTSKKNRLILITFFRISVIQKSVPLQELTNVKGKKKNIIKKNNRQKRVVIVTASKTLIDRY
jgi:hypothetical protein